jgi:hypothetical protein
MNHPGIAFIGLAWLGLATAGTVTGRYNRRFGGRPILREINPVYFWFITGFFYLIGAAILFMSFRRG